MTPEEKIAELGLIIPDAAPPVGSYLNSTRSGNLLHISGGLPIIGDRKFLGKVPSECDLETAQEAARTALLTRLAVIKAEAGSLDQVARIVSLSGYVNAEPDFTAHPQVINGASDLLVEIFGDAGRHSRAAVGCSSLPLGVSVEISLVVELKS
ncbi:MAG: RidA family protein [Akkermansiaceae bacterium]|nr:RidA family protein [Akkermansiaceae bacterium]MDG1669588.1 RidA family protein [Akkermansiaceae bacterium]MDG2323015.1 RidA family protein [Akkermansiaceae bacterium]